MQAEPTLELAPEATQQVQTPEATPSQSSYCSEYRRLIEGYEWDIETMLYAMFKESSCNPLAVGDDYPIAGVHAPSCGLLQVRTLAGRPSCEALKDPATNVAAAYKIWQSQGYMAWSTLH